MTYIHTEKRGWLFSKCVPVCARIVRLGNLLLINRRRSDTDAHTLPLCAFLGDFDVTEVACAGAGFE